jgi:hypothetical protein
VADFCEHGNEPSGSIIWDILDWLRYWQLSKKASVSWSHYKLKEIVIMKLNLPHTLKIRGKKG